MPNYRDIELLIQDKKPFKHSHSMRALWDDENYIIYSYRTIIAVWKSDSNTWVLNTSKYSSTTSRQQSLIKRVVTRDTSANVDVML